jgi:hypothetical protein
MTLVRRLAIGAYYARGLICHWCYISVARISQMRLKRGTGGDMLTKSVSNT